MRRVLILFLLLFTVGCLPWPSTVFNTPTLVANSDFHGAQIVRASFGAEQIQATFEEKLHPYFQNARVVLKPEAHGVFGLTCIQGAGPQLAIEAGDMVQQELGKNDASGIAARLFLAANSYRYILVGFDTYIAVFDLQTKTAGYKPVADAAYSQLYRSECGL